MRWLTLAIVSALLLQQQSCSAFTTGSVVAYNKYCSSLSSANNGDSNNRERFEQLIPETSFGAEAVPEGQRPVNEYLDMTKQPLFGWASNDNGNQGLLIRLAGVYAISFGTVCWPIAGATYTQENFLLQKLAAANVGAVTLIGFLLLRLYSGWGYVGTRLTSKAIEYEETGWYDGDFELKTDAERKRDKFLYNDKVKPVENRLKLFSAVVGGIWIASIIGFNVANSQNPTFDEYDPSMLERLRYDEKLAEKVSSSSGGKPTYCDSRYYRAVAGGGQACDR
mmetsp:Transcript_18924/g.24345  ORF Transcript_18924/g.24345 Transcript_18924/m.24345 type:complete len:280 (-) Transcript_18924:64-903(-)